MVMHFRILKLICMKHKKNFCDITQTSFEYLRQFVTNPENCKQPEINCTTYTNQRNQTTSKNTSSLDNTLHSIPPELANDGVGILNEIINNKNNQIPKHKNSTNNISIKRHKIITTNCL